MLLDVQEVRKSSGCKDQRCASVSTFNARENRRLNIKMKARALQETGNSTDHEDEEDATDKADEEEKGAGGLEEALVDKRSC